MEKCWAHRPQDTEIRATGHEFLLPSAVMAQVFKWGWDTESQIKLTAVIIEVGLYSKLLVS